MNGKPREAIIKAMKLIAMEFDDMVIDKDTVEAWEELLSDVPDDLLLAAVKVSILKATYRPRIAEIRNIALSLINPESEIDAGRAWELVLQAIHAFGMYQTERALASLPPTVANAARRVGWGDLCKGEEMHGRAHFLTVFEDMQRREKEIGVLPPALQAHFRQAALESGPVSLGELLAPKAAALPTYQPAEPTRSSGYVPPQNVIPFRRKPQARSAEELRAQAELLKQQTPMNRESAEFKAMTEEERADHLKQQAQTLGGAA